MTMKKMMRLALTMLLALSMLAVSASALALAETTGDTDLQAQLDAANARIAELEAQVEKYLPYYEAQIVAEYGEGSIIWKEDAQKMYDQQAAYLSQYGVSIDAYASQVKQSVLESLVEEAVLNAKAAELGLDVLDEEARAALEANAQSSIDMYVENYKSNFAAEGKDDDQVRAETLTFLEQNGVTQQSLLDSMIANQVSQNLHDYVVKDVAVDDDEVKAAYDAMVEADTASYADDRAYNNARSSGTTIAWNPEGYRAVKHVLVKFSDEQATQYSELQSTLKSLNDELAALDAPAEEAEEKAEEAIEEEAQEGEEPEEPRTREEIQTDIGAVGAEIEALYSSLLPRAQEVIDAFNNGTSFEDLIAQYGEDPGMTREPAASQGYAVAEGSTTWDPAFTEGAMSIAEVGGISEPVYGQNGIHIIWYMSDITPGAVPFEEIEDAVREKALDDKTSQTYTDQVAAWIEEAAPVYHADRF